MATSLNFSRSVKDIVPYELIEKLRIIPMTLRKDKLCLIARRPLTDQALMELKTVTGIEDYELQLVGDDVLTEYLGRFKTGALFDLI
jgi:hypothetical protein